jgi:hypothetical protein
MLRIFKNENGRKFKTSIPRVGKQTLTLGEIKSIVITNNQQKNVINSAWGSNRTKLRDYASL